MKSWTEVIIKPESSIFDAIAIINRGALQIGLVVDTEGRLMGTVSDGDVRRAILKGVSMQDSVQLIMNSNPTVADMNASSKELLGMMEMQELRQIPIVDKERKVIRIETWLDAIRHSPKSNPVLLMAGGVGKRLGNLTACCPKPMLKVGDKPILQTILESFAECGFQNFYLSVNYKAEMIRKHFGNGEKWGVRIRYLQEDSPLGTAGALALLPEAPTQPIIVMNGDILTKVDFENLLAFHKQTRASATMCIRDYQIQVPYGVVEIEDHRLVAIHEKPVQQYFVSAGIYVIEPDVLHLLAGIGRMDMPELFQAVMRENKNTSVFPIREYWIDIGRVDDYEKANGDYAGVFG